MTDARPNIQNIPIRTPAGQLIRQAFVPLPGTIFIEADYTSLELELFSNHVRIRKPFNAVVGDQPDQRTTTGN